MNARRLDFAAQPARPHWSETFVIYLPAEVARHIKVLAAETDQTMQEIGEDMVVSWLKTNAPHPNKIQKREKSTPPARADMRTFVIYLKSEVAREIKVWPLPRIARCRNSAST